MSREGSERDGSERDTGERREPALEAAIAAAPESLDGYLVYADWLQQRGELRGELIVVQRALAAAPNDAALRAREAALFAEHGELLLGPLARASDARMDWRCGFVRAIDLGSSLSEADPALLVELLAHPSMQFVHRFAAVVGADADIVPLAERAPRTLRWLELSGDPDRIGALKARLGRLPIRLLGVEHLQIGTRMYRSVAEWLADSVSGGGG